MLSSTNNQDDTLGLGTPALEQGTESSSSTARASPPPSLTPSAVGSADLIFGDDFLNSNDSLDAFLTSPVFGDSPIDLDETPLFTPALGLSSARADVDASPPIITDAAEENFAFSLFADPLPPSVTDSLKVLMAMTPDPPAKHSFDGLPPSPTSPLLYTMTTPALPSANLYPSPRLPSAPLPTPDMSASASAACGSGKTRSSSSRSGKAIHTGHRKNLSMSALVPLDAPTQPRNYLTPSLTSRKELPPSLLPKRGVASRKRSRAQAEFEDEEDEDDGVDVSLLSEVELKRRQNTIAARKSRMRKKEHVFTLEAQLADMTAERDELLAQNEALIERLREHGLLTD